MVRPFRYTTTRTILSFPHESYRPRGIGIGTLAAVHVSNLKVRGTLARMDLPTTSYRTGSFLPGSNRGHKLTLAEEKCEQSRFA